MQYMLLIMGDETKMNATEVDETGMSADYAAYNQALAKAGAIRGGERLLDGPYTETQEQLGGFYIIDVPSIDEAIEWAKKCPAAQLGTIEVRPIWPTVRN
jgi:hypothetical protein